MTAYQELRGRAEDVWRAVERPPRPLVRVTVATCSLAVKADATLDALRRDVQERGLDVDVAIMGDTGLCWVEPAVEVRKPDGSAVLYGEVTPDRVSELVDEALAEDGVCRDLAFAVVSGPEIEGVPRLEEIDFWKVQDRRLIARCGLIDPENIDHYIATGGYEGLANVLETDPEENVGTLKDSTLKGRSGSNFPTGTKWDFLRGKTRGPKYLLCNADEGDPGAFVNRILMESDPHSIIEGMVIGAQTTGATEGIIYIREEYPLCFERMQRAVEQAYERGLLGEGILGTDLVFNLRAWLGAGSYVCGEESGLISSLDDSRGMPRVRPPYPADVGVFGQPSNVNNIETYASVALIMQKGLEFHNSVGTERNRGSKVFSFSGHVQRPGVLEVPFGVTLRSLWEAANPDPPVDGRKLKAVQAGGPLTGILPADVALDLTMEPEEFREHGVLMGGGGIVFIDDSACAVDLNRMFTWFLEDESCGRCTTCHGGTQRMTEIFKRIARGNGAQNDYDKMEILGEALQWSNCVHGQASPTIMLNTAEFFREEVDEHINKGRCPARVCKDLIRYEVHAESPRLAEAADLCPTDAIVQEGGGWAINERCIKCDACREVAPEAIRIVDAAPPERIPVRAVGRDARGSELHTET